MVRAGRGDHGAGNETSNMSNPFGTTLPAGVSNSDIDGPEMGEERCSTCDGQGHLASVCCGGAVSNGICHECKQPSFNLKCPDCKDGVSTYSVSERHAEQRAEAAEAKADMERDER